MILYLMAAKLSFVMENCFLLRASSFVAWLYNMTPMKTTAVPTPLHSVTGFPNRSTDSQMRKARLTVLATLRRKIFRV